VLPESFAHSYPLRVRYCDTDCSGVVYHARYLDYFEWGRTELLRSAGWAYSTLEQEGFALVVTEARVRYLLPAYYDEELMVDSRVVGHSGARLQIDYELRRGQELLATGATTLGCVDRVTRRPRRLPVRLAPARKSSPAPP
jgi:acyl-CoA thioester hydrolase